MTDGPGSDSSLLPRSGPQQLHLTAVVSSLPRRAPSSLEAPSDHSLSISLCSGRECPCSGPVDAVMGVLATGSWGDG